ncbi:MAG: S8 family serine peptidase [Lachnospiraceae bacterium]|nr:S8 family serine peptidase [Robinsoniella sp.]MDY3766446.1 S8 family serine peptidase [Lachnospiraceae bacterium]
MKISCKKISGFVGLGLAFLLLFSMGALAAGKTRVIQTDTFTAFSEATSDLNHRNGAQVQESEDSSPYATMRLIVKSKGAALDLTGYGAETVLAGPNGYYIMQFNKKQETEKCEKALKTNPNVQYVESDRVVHLSVEEGQEVQQKDLASNEISSVLEPDNSSDAYSWGVSEIEADKYASYLKSSGKTQTIYVAVVDSGVWRYHEMLSSRVVSNLGYDYVDNDSNPFNDGKGHGTHVAGTIVDCTPGLNVKIIAVRVLDDTGFGYNSDIANGIYYAVDHGAKVINLSLVGDDSFYQHDAISYALSKGVVVVAAAGNNSTYIGDYCPAHIPECITVSALDIYGSLADYSNYGETVDVAAPGTNVLSCGTSSGSYIYMSGTSMATPHVSAVAAMYRLAYPTAGPVKIQELVKRYTKDLGTSGFDTWYGYGIPKMSKAIPVTVERTRLESAQALGTSEVRITWAKASGATGYYVYRKLPGKTWQRIKDITSGSTTTYTDTGLKPGTKYIYTVRGYKKSGSTVTLGTYDAAGIWVITGLDTPTLKSATCETYNSIRISWTPVTAAMGYRVYRRTSATESWVLIGRITGQGSSSLVDKKAVTGTTYYYTVRATCTYDGTMKMSSYNSNGIQGKATLARPQFTASSIIPGAGIGLTWTKVDGATGYVVGRSTSPSGTYEKVGAVPASSTSLVDTKVERDCYVYYRVRAYRTINGKNVYSAFSPVITAYSAYYSIETTDYLNTHSVDIVNDATIFSYKIGGMKNGYNAKYPDLYEVGEGIAVGVNEESAENRVEVKNTGNQNVSIYGLTIGDDSITVERVLKENGFRAVSGEQYHYIKSDGTKLSITISNGKLAAFSYYF